MFKLTYNDLKTKRKEELITYILEDRRDSLTGIEDIIESIRDIDLNYNQENFILKIRDLSSKKL